MKRSHFKSFYDCDEATSDQDIEKDLLKNERDIMLHRLISELKNDYRQVLYLSYFEELSNNDIAKIMNKSRRQIENLSYNAKKVLRTKLLKEGFTYDEL